jgi:hypothetical protein
MRGWDLYRGVKHALTGHSQYGPQVELRALLEAAILCRWMEDDPVVRSELWLAEDRRSQLRGEELGRAFRRMRGGDLAPIFSDADRDGMRQEVEQARQRARDAGTPDVPEKGRVLPTITAMTESNDDLRETTFLYWSLSPFAHAGGRSFAGDDLEKRGGKTYLAPRPSLRTPAGLMGVAESTPLHLWACASRQVGLGIEAECNELRLSVVFPERKAAK